MTTTSEVFEAVIRGLSPRLVSIVRANEGVFMGVITEELEDSAILRMTLEQLRAHIEAERAEGRPGLPDMSEENKDPLHKRFWEQAVSKLHGDFRRKDVKEAKKHVVFVGGYAAYKAPSFYVRTPVIVSLVNAMNYGDELVRGLKKRGWKESPRSRGPKFGARTYKRSGVRENLAWISPDTDYPVVNP